MRRRQLGELLGPLALVVVAGLLGMTVSSAIEVYFINALVAVAMVGALYTFVGNSGVLSFGHMSFVAVGAWTAGVLTVPSAEKSGIMPDLWSFLLHASVGNVPSLLLAGVVGGVYAAIVGLPLMRLSGLGASIATFGVLEITYNLLYYYDRIGPGSSAFSSVPETTGLLQAALGAIAVVVVAFVYRQSRFGTHAVRDARGSRRGPGGRRLDLPAAPARVHGLGGRSRASRAGCSCTCCRSRPRRCTCRGRSSPSRCSSSAARRASGERSSERSASAPSTRSSPSPKAAWTSAAGGSTCRRERGSSSRARSWRSS